MQGLNRLAGIALLFLNEEDAFWCLVAIVDYIMPQDYYSKTLLASQADQVSVITSQFSIVRNGLKKKSVAVSRKLDKL